MDVGTVEIFKRVVEELPLGFIMYDPNYKILIVNKKTEELAGVPREELINQTFSVKDKQGTKLWFLAQVLFPSVAPKMDHISPPGEYPQVVSISFDDPRIELLTTTLELTNPQGGTVGFVKLIEDKTREAIIMQSKHQFVSLVSHQLRTPLTAVNWTFQLLLKDELSKNQREVIETGARAANELVSRIDDTVEVAKIEDGRFDYKFSSVDIVRLLHEVLERANLMAGQYEVTVSTDIKEENLEIKADKHKLSVAIANLIDNALKYSRGETVAVTLEKLSDQLAVAIKIQDTGIGISDKDKEGLFTKFFRAENARKVQPDGNGLGLFIAKNVIEKHGGKIVVDSTLNQGSTFTAVIPIAPNPRGLEKRADA